MAQQIAQAAIAFEQRRTGNRGAKSLSVVLSEGTLVIPLHEALSPAEKVLARSPAGAARSQALSSVADKILEMNYWLVQWCRSDVPYEPEA
jgi:uncharacterized protein YbcI